MTRRTLRLAALGATVASASVVAGLAFQAPARAGTTCFVTMTSVPSRVMLTTPYEDDGVDADGDGVITMSGLEPNTILLAVACNDPAWSLAPGSYRMNYTTGAITPEQPAPTPTTTTRPPNLNSRSDATKTPATPRKAYRTSGSSGTTLR